MVEFLHTLFELLHVQPHALIEIINLVLPHQSDTRLRPRDADVFPEGSCLAANRCESFELWMTSIDQLLAGGKEITLGSERAGGG